MPLPESYPGKVTKADFIAVVEEVNAASGTYVAGVLPQRFGAVGDGDADDTAELQAAIDYVANNGGFVYLPAGIYKITAPLVIKPYVSIYGADRLNTVIMVGNGANCDVIVTENWAALWDSLSSGGVYAFTLSNFTIDGNRANNTVGDGIKLYGYEYVVEHITVANMADRGIVTDWSPDAEPVNTRQASESRLSNFKVLRCGGNGIEFGGPHDSQIHTGIVALCNSDDNAGGKGFWVKPRSAASHITNVHVWGTTHYYAWYVEAPCYLTEPIGDGVKSTGTVMACLSNDIVVNGGKLFVSSVQSPSAKGLVLGDASHTGLAGLVIDTKVNDCQGGSVDFTYLGQGNVIRVLAYQTSGTTTLGSPGAANDVAVLVNGSAYANVYRRPEPKITRVNSTASGDKSTTSAVFLNIDATNFAATLPAREGDVLRIVMQARFYHSLADGDGAIGFTVGGTFEGGSNGTYSIHFESSGTTYSEHITWLSAPLTSGQIASGQVQVIPQFKSFGGTVTFRGDTNNVAQLTVENLGPLT